MDEDGTSTFARLSDTTLTISDPDEDLRGRPVRDAGGYLLGTVDELVVDLRARRVRYLRIVGHAGAEGLTAWVAAESVLQVTPQGVLVQTSGARSAVRHYDPALCEAAGPDRPRRPTVPAPTRAGGPG